MENTDIQKVTKNKKFYISNYFQIIDIEAKAYILGYIIADESYDYLYKDATIFLTRKKISAFNSVLNAFNKRRASV